MGCLFSRRDDAERHHKILEELEGWKEPQSDIWAFSHSPYYKQAQCMDDYTQVLLDSLEQFSSDIVGLIVSFIPTPALNDLSAWNMYLEEFVDWNPPAELLFAPNGERARYDQILKKILIIGDSEVGKSVFLQMFAEDEFIKYDVRTIGVDFKQRTLQLRTKANQRHPTIVRVQLWELAGHEKYRFMNGSSYRNAAGIIIMFNVFDELTFHHVTSDWKSEVEQHASNVSVVLVGNHYSKLQSQKRQVSFEAASEFARKMNWAYFEIHPKRDVTDMSSVYWPVAVLASRLQGAHQGGHMERIK